MTGFDALKLMETLCCGFNSKERHGNASNRELRQWLKDKAVLINGLKPGPDDEVGQSITQFILFPKHDKKRITIV
jgi:hypothetical protein